ncbi:MAG: gliding motility-associated C-terminal domain-containing protein [Chitinophagales bacterium]|nr:gliding motility-associated C-terminal domain-containing protein [Chitinophagales bacterium]
MMRKLTALLLPVFFFATAETSAQTYYQINALSGVTVINGATVTVSQSTPPPNSATLCSTGPYQIGKNYSDYYNYDFSTNPVTHFRLQMIRFHDDDTVEVYVNGSPYAITALNPYNGNATTACSYTTNNMSSPSTGLITTTGGATGKGQGVEIDITKAPGLIQSVRVRHIRATTNNLASDVIYNAYFADDSCSLAFEASILDPICAGKDVQLSVTNYPNTTYTWSSNTTPPTVFTASANDREPVIKNISPLNTGKIYIKGERGVCTYHDTLDISVAPAPVLGLVKQAGPFCPGEDDTLSVPNVSLPTGGDVYAWSVNGLGKFDATQGYIIPFLNVQPVSKGWYSIYAVDGNGCISDTVNFFFDVLSGVAANFNYNVKEGCEQDTVEFINTSVDQTSQTWNFGDNSPLGIDKNPVHTYLVTKPNIGARKFTVQLAIANGSCADTATQDIELNHPLIAEFTIDDDSICQGSTISFSNTSLVKAGTTPKFIWNSGYGDDFQVFGLDHDNQYNVAGIYHPKLTLTDYLGCVATYGLEIVVDSTGGILFTNDKADICIGDEIIFDGDYYAGGANSITWDLGDNTGNTEEKHIRHSYTKPGKYNVTYSVDYRICPDLQVSKEINAKPYPDLYLGEDTSICPNGNPIFISDRVNPDGGTGIKYKWHTADKDVTQGIYVHHPGMYSVTADLNGCSVTDSIEVKKDCYINIPNAFTPNGDGNSDYFLPRQILSRNVTEFAMQIYNRWGQLIYQTNVPDGRGWDGKFKNEEQPTGVYVYTIHVTFGNSVSERYQGNVTLLR